MGLSKYSEKISQRENGGGGVNLNKVFEGGWKKQQIMWSLNTF